MQSGNEEKITEDLITRYLRKLLKVSFRTEKWSLRHFVAPIYQFQGHLFSHDSNVIIRKWLASLYLGYLFDAEPYKDGLVWNWRNVDFEERGKGGYTCVSFFS